LLYRIPILTGGALDAARAVCAAPAPANVPTRASVTPPVSTNLINLDRMVNSPQLLFADNGLNSET
jgi:hypothetical protein